MRPFIWKDFYSGEGAMYDFVNEYESRQNPNMIHPTDSMDYRIYFRYFLQRVMSLFQFSGFPKEWNEEYFKTVLFLKGNLAVIDTFQYGVIPQHGAPWGFDVFYYPTNYLISNPALNNEANKDYKIHQDCEVVYMCPDWNGVGDLISAYAQRCAVVLSDIDVSGALAKFGFLFTAKNKTVAETLKTAFDDIMSGQLAVAVNQALYDKETGKPLIDMFNNDVEKCIQVLNGAIDAFNEIKQMFDEEIGLYTAPHKKERLITSEVDSTQNAVMSKCEMWKDTLTRCFERVNEMFGLDLSVTLRYNVIRSEGVFGDESDSADSELV